MTRSVVSLPLAIQTRGACSVTRVKWVPNRLYLRVASSHFNPGHSFSTTEYFFSLGIIFRLRYMIGGSSPLCTWDRMASSPVSHASVNIGTWKSGEHSTSFRRLNAALVPLVHFTVFGRRALVRSVRGRLQPQSWGFTCCSFLPVPGRTRLVSRCVERACHVPRGPSCPWA